MGNDKFEISTSPGAHNGQEILSLKGALTIQTIFAFQNAVREQNSSSLIIDFSGVPFMDSAGLGALVGARLALQKANRPFALAALNQQVRALLDMSHVSQYFRIFPTVEEAQASVA
jgi:anti-sigma B factor antagonist